MPRLSRTENKNETKVYHIIIRGVNKQDIFIDNKDKSKFLQELKLSKQEYNYSIYAYVLMTIMYILWFLIKMIACLRLCINYVQSMQYILIKNIIELAMSFKIGLRALE